MTLEGHVPLCTCENQLKAQLVKELLIAGGVAAELRYEGGGDPVGVIAETTGENVVTVPSKDLALAHKILKSAHEDGRVLREWVRTHPGAAPQ